MSLDSPVASEPDSLIEEKLPEKPLKQDDLERGHTNYSTFTRPRPTNLRKGQFRNHRQSLLSPHSVDNLDTRGLETPDFAMTQSMFEPNGKKEQLEKISQQSKLMNLIASEKAAQVAQKRKQKEMKQKVLEQKKRNEERQKIVEERRSKMLADEEEKRKRIINKIGKPNNMITSYMTQSICVKNKVGINSKFLSNRPMSSTGKVFGFGSSTPRYTCDPIRHEKVNNNSYLLDINKNTTHITRMCASQIMGQSTQHGTRGQSEKNHSSHISKSTFSICEINQLRNNNERISYSNVNAIHKSTKNTPKTIKSLKSSNIIEIPHKSPTEHLPRSCVSIKEATTHTKSPRHKTLTEKPIIQPSKPKTLKIPEVHDKEKKSILRSDDNKLNSKAERPSSDNKKIHSENHYSTKLKSFGECEQNIEKKSEVRFVTGSEISTKNDKESAEIIPERLVSNIKEVTNDEYKQRMSLQRKLAREKKLKEEMEKKIEKEKQNSEILQAMSPVDTSITTESDISINNLSKDKEQKENQNKVPDIQTESSIPVKEEETPCYTNTSVPNIEVTNEKSELTASTDELDRIERKKRLESIMSRIKKPPVGSIENVNHQMTSSVLQNMMEKGHLTGMSKTAAVLMRNAHRSSDFGSATLDIHGSTDTIRTISSMENLQNGDHNEVTISRGDCDGKEDSPKETVQALETKSNILQNISSNADNPYLSSWKDKYSLSDSLDSETDNTDGI